MRQLFDLTLLAIILGACSANVERNEVIEKEYLENEGQNRGFRWNLAASIDHLGNRPLDLEFRTRLDSLFELKYSLSFASEQNDQFPLNVMDEDVNLYLNLLESTFKETYYREEELEEFRENLTKIRSLNGFKYTEHLNRMIMLSILEREVIDRSFMSIGVDDCFFCFGMHLATNELVVGQPSEIVLTMTHFFYLETTNCSFRDVRLTKDNSEIHIKTRTIGNMLIVDFSPDHPGTYQISGIMDVKDKKIEHVYNYNFNKTFAVETDR
tara:strand:+ start:63 stop:866 length:804 start_codon:yes stop_codon:yes gene_type:complete